MLPINRDPGFVVLTAASNPFKVSRDIVMVREGRNLQDMLREAQPDPILARHAAIFINGHRIPEKNWTRIYPKEGTHVEIRVLPTGGGGGGGSKNILRTVLMVAVMALSIFVPPMLPLAGLAAGIGISTTALASVIGAAISVVGGLLVNALVPVRPPKIQTESAEQVYGIDAARNQLKPFGTVPQVLGRHRVAPNYGAAPYTEIIGQDQYLRMLFVWGVGPLHIDEASLKIGETPLTEFEGVEIEHRAGYAGDDPLTLYPDAVIEDQLQVKLADGDGGVLTGAHLRTSSADADELGIDFSWPAGIVHTNRKGHNVGAHVVVRVRYKPTGTDGWYYPTAFTAKTFDESWYDNVTGEIRFSGASRSPIRHGMRWSVDRGQYDVEVEALEIPNGGGNASHQVYWTALRTITDEDPVQSRVPVAKTALRIKASEQLNGVVDEFNGIVTTLGKDWNGTSWVDDQQITNPASIFRHILQGKANASAMTDDRLNLPNLQDWHEFCSANSFSFGQVRSSGSVWDALADCAVAGRAAPAEPDGQWGVVIDRPQAIPVSHITPRNSSGFGVEKSFIELPHGFRVPFINEAEDYRMDEHRVYRDGYSKDNATKFEAIEMPGITNSDQVWKMGRYRMAQGIHQAERWNFHQDMEYLTYQRGDRVKITHDVLLVGLHSGRIKSVTTDASNNVTGLELDETVSMETGKSYGIVIRTVGSGSVTAQVNTVAGDHNDVTLVSSIPAVGGIAAVRQGEIFGFGLHGLETDDALILSIKPSNDFQAQITAVPYRDEIYNSDAETIPPFDTKLTPLVSVTAPVVIGVESGEAALAWGPDGSLRNRIMIEFRRLSSSQQLAGFRIMAQIRPAGSDEPWQTPQIDERSHHHIVIGGVNATISYDIKLWFEAEGRLPGPASFVYAHTVTGKTNNPSPVTGVRVSGGVRSVEVYWDEHPQADFSHVRIETTPTDTYANATIVGSASSTNFTIAPVDAGTTVHVWLTAVDSSGNESTRAGPFSATATAVQTQEVADGAIISQKIAEEAISVRHHVATVQGNALNPDPHFMDSSVWDITNIVFDRVTDGKTGSYVVRSSSGANGYLYSDTFPSQHVPYDEDKVYKISAWARRINGGDGRFYIILNPLDSDGNRIDTATSTGFSHNSSADNLYPVASGGPTNDWTYFEVVYGKDTGRLPPPGTKFLSVGLILNYSNTVSGGGMEAQSMKMTQVIQTTDLVDEAVIEEKIANDAVTSDKVVDGAVIEQKIADGAVGSAKVADSAIIQSKIANGAVGTPQVADSAIITAKLADEGITNGKLAPGAVTTVKVADGAIVTEKLADEGITEGKLAPGAVTTVKVADGAIITNKLADEGITNGKLAPGAVTTVKVADSAIVTEKLAEGGIVEGKLANGAVTGTKIADDSISTPKLTANAVTAEKITAGAVVTDKLAANAVTANKISAGSVETDKLAANAVTTAKLTANAVTAEKIAAGSVLTDKLAANSVTANKISAGAVETDKLAANSITTAKITANAVTAEKIAAGSILTDKLAANSVTADKISAGAVETDKLAANSVTTAKLTANAVTAEKIAAGSILTDKIAAANITGDKIAANTLSAKNMVITGRGTALNPDPFFEDEALWDGWGIGTRFTIVNSSTAPRGSKVLRSIIGSYTVVYPYAYSGNDQFLIPFDEKKTYRISCYYVRAATPDGQLRTLIRYYDQSKTLIYGNQYPHVINGASAASGWTRLEMTFGPDGELDLPVSGAKYIEIGLLLNYQGTTGGYYISDFRVEEVIDGSLIVDGAITASKIEAAAVTGDKIAANTITTGSLLVTGENPVQNPVFATGDLTGWSPWSNGTSIRIATHSSYPSKYVAYFYNNTSTANSISIFTGASAYNQAGAIDNAITVVPGKQYDVRITVNKSTAAADSLFRVMVYFHHSDGTFTTNRTAISVNPSSMSTGWQELSGSFVVPAGCYAAHLYVIVSSYTGAFYFTNLRMFEKNAANLIVDGGIVARHISAGAIETDKLAANAVTAAKISANNVTSTHIASRTIEAINIKSGAITANELAANTITADKIASNAINTSELAAGAVTADKIAALTITGDRIAANTLSATKLVVTGRGRSVTTDPHLEDDDMWAWGLDRYQLINTNGALDGGGRYMRNLVGQRAYVAPVEYGGGNSHMYPFDPNKTYRVSFWYVATGGANGALYNLVRYYNGVRTLLQNGSQPNQYLMHIPSGSVPTGWTYREIIIGKTGIAPHVSGAKFFSFGWLLNWGGTAGYHNVSGIHVEEVVEGSLIVDGAITANKISAGAVESDKIAANSITSAKIGANQINANHIATGSITATQIKTGTITADRITVGGVTTDRIQSNAISRGASAHGAGGVNVSTSWTTLASVALTATGDHPVFIDFSFAYDIPVSAAPYYGGSNGAALFVRLLRNGAIIYDTFQVGSRYLSTKAVSSGSEGDTTYVSTEDGLEKGNFGSGYRDNTPASGSNKYVLQAYRTNPSGSSAVVPVAYRRTIFALELKR